MQVIVALVAGLIFGLGILISGMASPAKVLNFFDVAGSWDPSLAFVMGGALVTTLTGYRLIFLRNAPIFSARFHLPTKNAVDAKLIAGAAIFGIGWGVTGFCPGGAIPALGTGRNEVMIFIVALTVGIIATRIAMGRLTESAPAKPSPGNS